MQKIKEDHDSEKSLVGITGSFLNMGIAHMSVYMRNVSLWFISFRRTCSNCALLCQKAGRNRGDRCRN